MSTLLTRRQHLPSLDWSDGKENDALSHKRNKDRRVSSNYILNLDFSKSFRTTDGLLESWTMFNDERQWHLSEAASELGQKRQPLQICEVTSGQEKLWHDPLWVGDSHTLWGVHEPWGSSLGWLLSSASWVSSSTFLHCHSPSDTRYKCLWTSLPLFWFKIFHRYYVKCKLQ